MTAYHPEASKRKWSDFDLRTMVERGKQPRYLRSIVRNRSTDAYFITTTLTRDVDKTRYVTIQINSVSVMVARQGEIADEL